MRAEGLIAESVLMPLPGWEMVPGVQNVLMSLGEPAVWQTPGVVAAGR